ncbi:MAG: PQQ-binding-like beta-propeller repeat protein [Pirellulaceae bacterium]
MRLRIVACWMFAIGAFALSAQAENWSGWRGPRGDGSSLEKDLPTSWDGTTGENIRWKVEIPGEGHSSPVVWDDRLFLTSCLPDRQQRVLLCLDRESGETLWTQTVLESQLETKHNLNSHASATPATDGELVFVSFLEIDGHTIPAPNVGRERPVTPGEIVVAAYDFDGKLHWKSKVGEFISAHGFCSNPVLHEGLVILNGDHDGDSYLVALDRDTGKQRWRVKREHGIRSYATPIIRDLAGRTQMVLSGSQSVVSYNPKTGESYWSMEGPTEQFVASMVDDGKYVYLTAGFPEHHIVAIRPDGEGDITDSHIVWREKRGAAYVPSPIIVGPYLVLVSDDGIGSCFEAATGERHWMARIGTRFSASPVAADGLVYFVADQGVTTVLRAGPEFERIADCPLGEVVSSSPAISQGCLYIRGHEHLFCIGTPE